MNCLLHSKPTVKFNHTTDTPHWGSESKPTLLLPGSHDALTANLFFPPEDILLISVRMKATLTRPFWKTRKRHTKVIQGCMSVSNVDTTDFYNWLLFLYLFVWFVFAFFCTTLWVWRLRTRLPRHCCPRIMHLLWSVSEAQSQPLNGSEVHVACVRWSIIRFRRRFNPLFCQRTSGGLIWSWISCFLRRNATSWTSVSVSLLILECRRCLQVSFQTVTEVSSSRRGDLYLLKAF